MITARIQCPNTKCNCQHTAYLEQPFKVTCPACKYFYLFEFNKNFNQVVKQIYPPVTFKGPA